MTISAALVLIPLVAPPAGALGSATWVKLAPASHPSARYWSAIAYDAAHSQLVLFGGKKKSAPESSLGDTWVWNGSTWTQKAPAHSPSARHGAMMAYDPVAQRIMLFGGFTQGFPYHNDTWVWNGSDWTDISAGLTPPSVRGWSGFALDPTSQKLVLFGGYDGTNDFGDTWTWTGTDWSQLSPAHAPAARDDFVMVSDTARSQIVLYGGVDDTNDYTDTWVWNGTDWVARSSTGLGPITDMAATYDPRLGRVVVFGGYRFTTTDTAYQGTWTWTGSAWQALAVVAKPSARDSATAAYFPPGGNVVLFGGFLEGNVAVHELAETWVLRLATGTASPAITTTSSATKSFTVSWLAPGAPSSYVVQYATRVKNASGVWVTGAFKTWKTVTGSTHSAVFPGAAGVTYLFRVNAVYSGGASTGYSPAVVTVVPLDERSAVFSTGWTKVAASGRYLGTVTYTTTANRTMTLKTDALTYTLIGDKCSACGKMRVYVDGVLISTVDTYRSTTAVRQALFTRSFSSTKPHTLKVVTLGTAGRPRVYLDAISVRR